MKLTKKCLALLACSLCLGNAVASDDDVLRVGSLTVYPPFEYLNTHTQRYEGFDIDLMDEVAKRAGFKYRIYSMGLDALVPALMTNSIDMSISALTITPERSAKVAFSKPYYDSGLTVMTHVDNVEKIKTLKDLENKRLCVEIGSSGAVFSKKIPGAKIRAYNSAAEAFLEINQKGCFAMLNDRPVNEYFLARKKGGLKIQQLPMTFSEDKYGIAVPKNNTKLLKAVNEAIDGMKADGTYDKIYQKWFAAK